jgi:uncharacterized lipoprotein YajG
MRIRLLLAAAAALTLAACSADSSTSPRLSPAGIAKDEITCRSGYHIATREDGSESCEPDGGFFRAAPAAAAPADTTD